MFLEKLDHMIMCDHASTKECSKALYIKESKTSGQCDDNLYSRGENYLREST